MAEETKKPRKPKTANPLIGAQTKPVTLDSTTKLDIDTNKEFVDTFIQAALSSQLNTSAIENFTTISNSRDQIYQLIDTMCQDAAVASIVRTYAEEATSVADNGHIVWCESEDPKISKFVNYLLNVMNIDKNAYGWIYSLIKYGDLYLKLYRESDYEDPLFKKEIVNEVSSSRSSLNESAVTESIKLSTHGIRDPYSYYVEQVADPSTMYEATKYGKTYGYFETPNAPTSLGYDTTNGFAGLAAGTYNFKMKSADVIVHQADDYVHACLEDGQSRFPETVDMFLTDDDYNSGANAHSYTIKRGKSMLYDSYKIWREKQLLEAAILLTRVTRSSIFRKVTVETGDMPREQVQQLLRRVKEMFEQRSSVDVGNNMSEFNNPGAIENFIYFATHNGQGAVNVESIGGDINVKDLADLDNWINKFYSAYGIPKQYFGYTDDGAGFNGGSSLAIISSVFAKGIIKIQNAFIQMITDAINLILVNKGYVSYLNNFVLKMKAPITQEEIDYRNALTNKINAISNTQSLFADVEDKARKLRLLKELLKQLNYGDEINAILDEEIVAAEKKARDEAKAAEEAAAAEAEAAAAETESQEAEIPAEEPAAEEESGDIDLQPVELESFKADADATVLTEDGAALEESDFLSEADDLPTPEELDANKDFTENN